MISEKTRSLLAAARVPNLPGVACHSLTGALVARHFAADAFAGPFWLAAAGIALAGVLLCLAGNLLNDWHDRHWDARHRPERALPAGRFRPATFLAAGLVALAAGLALAFACSPASGVVAIAIAACIASYTRWHKSSAWTVLPLAACRALLPLLGALAIIPPDLVSPTLIAPACLALGLVVAGLSLDARGESRPATHRAPRWPKILIWAAPLIPAAILFHPAIAATPAALLAPIAAFVWFAIAIIGPLRHTAKQRVSALLAGLPLIDLATLISANPTATGPLLIPIAAFALGRWLQRAAAAT